MLLTLTPSTPAGALLFLSYECALMSINAGGRHHTLLQCGHQLGLHTERLDDAPGLAGAGWRVCRGSPGPAFHVNPPPLPIPHQKQFPCIFRVACTCPPAVLQLIRLGSPPLPAAPIQAYTVGITAVFAFALGHLEAVLIAKALKMASAAGMTLGDVANAVAGCDVTALSSSSTAAQHPGTPAAAGQPHHLGSEEEGIDGSLARAMASKQPSGGQPGLLW